MAAALITKADILARAQRVLAERLPPGWELRAVPLAANSPADAAADLVSPDGQRSRFAFEAKGTVDSRDVRALGIQLERYRDTLAGSLLVTGVVVARYLPPPVRRKLSDAGLSYMDATGNLRVTSSKPGLFLSDHGTDSDPWRRPGRRA